MIATNDITGDAIRSRASNSCYRERFDNICWSKLHFPPKGYHDRVYNCPDCGVETRINLDFYSTKGV